MRPIEFRAKRVKDDSSVNAGRWVHGSLVRSLDGMFIYGYQVRCMVKVDPNTVCEYSGLKDVKGNKLYEGDIVAIKDTGDGFYSQIGTIEFVDYGFQYVMRKNIDNKRVYAWLTDGEFELIGNVFDNPELLGKGGGE